MDRPTYHDEESTEPSAGAELAMSPARTFKACRLCRRLKMRCERGRKPPCNRCSTSGLDCIFDLVGMSRKRKAAAEEGLREEIQQLKRHVASLAQAQKGPASTDISAEDAPFDALSHGKLLNEPPLIEENGLSPEQLNAPVNAVHDLAPGHNPSEAPGDTPRIYTNEKDNFQSLPWTRRRELTPEAVDDVVTKQLIAEGEARKLFNIYMAGSNPYLPLFEPTIDNFDSVRSSSTLLFTAVLLIASRTESGLETFSKRCHEEASRLSADSLFSSPARLESVQALLLLAAWSEKPWFALGHAVNMAKDLGLHQILSTPSNNAIITRQARTWLILYHLEREIAFGTSREPQLAPLEEKQPEYLLNCNRFHHLDLRFLSIIKLVQIRESLQKGVHKEKRLPLKASSVMRDARTHFDKWECFWDLQHKGGYSVDARQPSIRKLIDRGTEYGYCTSSFQRTSLTVQKSYATVLVCCTILSELQKEGHRAQSAASFSDMAKETLQAVTDHLQLIVDQTAFKWQLQFSPTYSALTVAFSACLALTLSKTHSGITQQRRLVDLARKISALLKAYPNQKFHLLLESFLVRFQQFSEEGRLPRPLDPEPLQTTASVTGSYSARFPQERPEVTASVLGSLQEREDQCADPLDTADTLHYKQLEAMLELPPESWFLDPFSAEGLGFEDN